MTDPSRYNTPKTSASGAWQVFSVLIMTAMIIVSCGGSSEDNNTPVVFSPVVFTADKDVAGVVELFASSRDGADIIKLSGNPVAGGDVVDFAISPDGVYVAYVADQNTDGVFELYVVPVDKSSRETAVKISGTFMAGDGIVETSPGQYAFAWAPDSSRVAYLADQLTAGVVELFSNQPTGNSTTTILLSRPLLLPAADIDVSEFEWAPDSSLIAYRANQTSSSIVDLYTTAPNQGFSQQITSGLAPGRQVTEFAWSPVTIPPSGFRIAFIADKTIQGVFQLWTTSPNNSNNVLVSGTLTNLSGDVIVFAWAPQLDSSDVLRIAYIADEQQDEVFELFTTTSNAPNVTKISGNLVNGGDVSDFAWAPDSSRVAYSADQDTLNKFELYTSPPDRSSGNVKISGTPMAGDGVVDFAWAPDSSVIAYSADQDTADVVELYTSPPASAGGDVKVSGTPVAGGGVVDFSWAPDSSRLAYIADENTIDVFELYTATPDGSVNDLVSGSLVAGGIVEEAAWSPDSTGVGYIADQDTNEVFELFASQPDGSDNTNLSGDLVAGGDVFTFEWVP